MKNYIYIGILLVSIVAASCSDFLSQHPKDLIYATSVNDLDELLVGEGYMATQVSTSVSGTTSLNSWIHVMDDDVCTVIKPLVTPDFLPFHYWQAQPFQNSKGLSVADPMWPKLYKNIGTLNVVLSELEEYRTSEPREYARVKGEALFLRAGYYFLLTNIYAKPYEKKSANQDLGVPIKLTAPIEDKDYSRNTLDEVYQKIIEDLKQSIIYLKGLQQPNVYRVNEFAARALLSRVYLYTTDYQKCVDQCDTILQGGQYNLLNLNQVNVTNGSTIYAGSSETIFSQGEYRLGTLMNFGEYGLSQDLIDQFDKQNDLRYLVGVRYETKISIAYNLKGYFSRKLKQWSDGGVSDCFLIRLPEVYLNKAEALAMLQHDDKGAFEVLQVLREQRYKTGNLPRENFSGKELVNLIRKERRLELVMEGHRWFDIRRYAVAPLYPDSNPLKHVYTIQAGTSFNTVDKGYYYLDTYAKDAGGYALPIPTYEMTHNNGQMVNNNRPQRDLIEY